MIENAEEYIRHELQFEFNSEITQKFIDAGLEIIHACISCRI
ncbi:MAG: hypothetical protein Lokiarch_10740 [Candidatus Lokiarchaeum sp. GC14_75]|nr:MAG: hypothetical protein Lokiarch_10740 [Candidatus Lokiarchaeum sp. GC14_75]